MGLRAPWAQYFTSLDIENSLCVLCPEFRPRLQKWFSEHPSKMFFFKMPELVYRTAGALPPKITARWRHRLPIKNLTAHYDSQFCVSFYFCFAQEA